MSVLCTCLHFSPQICNSKQYVAVAAEEFASVQAITEGKPRSNQSAPPPAPPPPGATNRPSGCDRYKATRVTVGAGLVVKDGEVHVSDSGVKVQADAVPHNKLTEVEDFYVCRGCGKVYWEGGHFDRTLKRYQQLWAS